MRLDKRQFTERHGEPTDFIFKGQCYDASPVKMTCAICGSKIRFCYILMKDTTDRSVPSFKISIGDECFEYFHRWNPPLFRELLAAQEWLMSTVRGEQHDKVMYGKQKALSDLRRELVAVKRKAQSQLREHKKRTGKNWLPEDLFELSQELKKAARPGTTPRWYKNRLTKIQPFVQERSK